MLSKVLRRSSPKEGFSVAVLIPSSLPLIAQFQTIRITNHPGHCAKMRLTGTDEQCQMYSRTRQIRFRSGEILDFLTPDQRCRSYRFVFGVRLIV